MKYRNIKYATLLHFYSALAQQQLAKTAKTVLLNSIVVHIISNEEK